MSFKFKAYFVSSELSTLLSHADQVELSGELEVSEDGEQTVSIVARPYNSELGITQSLELASCPRPCQTTGPTPGH